MSQRDNNPPEDSVALRTVTFCMTMLCIMASCFLIKTAWPVTVLAFVLATLGSFVAYQHRYEKIVWMQYVVIAGVLAAGVNALSEFMNPVNGPYDFWGPIVHFIACTFALHAFDLRSRSDVNVSAFLGALILCCLSPIVRGLAFGGIVFTYICLGTVMLYFDSLSRIRTNWLESPMRPAPVVHNNNRAYGTGRRRQWSLVLLPLLSLVCFLFIPRTENILDTITSSLKSANFAGLLGLLPHLSLDSKGEDKSPRNPYTPPTRNLGHGAKLDASKFIKSVPEREKPSERGTSTRQAERKTDTSEVPQEQKKNPAKEDKNSQKKSKPEAEKVAPKESAAVENSSEQKSQDLPNHGRKNSKDKTKGAGQSKSEGASELSTPGGADGSSAKGSGPGSHKDAKSGNGKAGASGKAGAGGTSGGNSGAGSPAIGSGGAGRGGKSPREIVSQIIDGPPDLSNNFDTRGFPLFRVTSTRPVYLRNRAYDFFDGVKWSQSKEKARQHKIAVDSMGEEVAAAKPEGGEELSPEAQAAKELEEEKFKALQQDDLGFGADVKGEWIFAKPEKPSYRVKLAQPLIVPAKLPCVDVTQSIEAVSDWSNSIPGAYYPQTVGYFGRTLTVEDDGSITGSEVIRKGVTFRVGSQIPIYALDSMRSEAGISSQREEAIRERLKNYLQLPETLSEEVIDFANKTVGANGNWYVQAERLCAQLREQAIYEEFKTRDFAPEKDRISQLLFTYRKGSVEDFASTYVMLCRAVGLPARIVSGFRPGTVNAMTGVYEVGSSEAFGWAEVYIPDYGWVPFDATPDGVMPALQRPVSYNIDTVSKFIAQAAGVQDDGEGVTPRKVVNWFAIILTALIAVAAVIMLLTMWFRRKRDQSQYQAKRGPEWAIYCALMKELKKAQLGREHYETSQDYIHRLENMAAGKASSARAPNSDGGGKSDADVPSGSGDSVANRGGGAQEGLATGAAKARSMRGKMQTLDRESPVKTAASKRETKAKAGKASPETIVVDSMLPAKLADFMALYEAIYFGAKPGLPELKNLAQEVLARLKGL
jgi:transglutaminase-like putative cysteine protease